MLYGLIFEKVLCIDLLLTVSMFLVLYRANNFGGFLDELRVFSFFYNPVLFQMLSILFVLLSFYFVLFCALD